MVWTANSCDFRHVAVLGRLLTHHGGAQAKSASYPPGVGKSGPASAGKAKKVWFIPFVAKHVGGR